MGDIQPLAIDETQTHPPQADTSSANHLPSSVDNGYVQLNDAESTQIEVEANSN